MLRSGCADCSATPANPEAIGWVDPLTGAFTAGPVPPDAGPCSVGCSCSPSIATTPMCRPDGSTVLVVVRNDCADCDTPAPDPVVVGWIDPLTGVFTPGPAPADAGACTPDCVDTICRQRCDDADGDGAADATYSELWCIAGDGTASLLLTYQDDPSTPYTPVSPVDCIYGCAESETRELCDTAPDGTVTAFLRRYSFLDGVATYEDVALDGQTPYVITGTVGACSATQACNEPTTPAATLGLCLADGTPIAVVVTRDCDGVVTQDGWINLVTGTYSVGDPPAGTMACGNPRSITTAGTFCDVDPASGDVLGLVLIEYTYGADGAVAAVRLVDATTGQTYTPQGEVTTCPAGVEQPERDLVQLCDVAADGTTTEFVRDFARDENGAITGHTDYHLDGTPYTPAGTVGVCPAQSACLDCTTHVLCDTDASPPAAISGTAASGTLSNGVAWTATAPNPFPPSRQGDGAAWWGVALFPNPSVPTTVWTFDQPVNVEFSVIMNWSPGTGAQENLVQLPAGAVPISLPAGYTYDRTSSRLRADNTLTPCTINNPTRAASARFRVTGVTSFSARYLGTRAINTDCRVFGHWVFGALDVSLGGEFLRTVCRDCTGAVTSTTDTLLDGTTPYTPVGLVGVCPSTSDGSSSEPCRDTSQTLLCDTATTEVITVLDPANRADADGWEVVSFTGANPGFGPEAALPYPARHGTPMGYPALGARADQNAGSSGGNWTGYDAAPVRWVLRKTFQAPEDGVAVAQSVGFRADGGARVRINGIDAGMYGQWNQPATSGTAQIPVTAGPNTVEIEVRDTNGINNLVGRLDVALPRTTQFMRKTVTDCETGETVAVVDTTLDGDPYEVTGTVGQCEPVAECCEQPPPEARVDVETALLCVRDTASGDTIGQVLAERVYDDQSGDLTEQRLTDLDGAPYTLPAGAELALCQEPDCPVAFSTECVGAVTRTEASYDNTSLIGGLPGQCGSVQGPDGQFPCQPGPFTITSWIVDGVEVIAEGGGRTFNGGDCGPGTAGAPGMHLNWAQALTNLDPTGAAWEVKSEPACAWFVGSTGGTETVYGPMTVQDTAGQQWILGPAQDCLETQFTKVYTQQCDGTVTVSWLDAQGVETAAPDGDLVPCGTGCGAGGGQGLDVETLTLCDVQADGTAVPFLRHLTYGSAGQVTVVLDTALDGVAPYTPTGTVGRCQSEGRDVEIVPMCVVDNGSGSVIQRILAEITYDTATGARLGVTYVDPLTWGPVAMPGGTHLDLCPEAQPDAEPCRNSSTLLVCDLPGEGEPAPTVTDTDPTPYDAGTPGAEPVTGGAAALWSGGVLTIPPDTTAASDGSVQRLRSFAATVQAPRPGCDTGTATVTASVRIERDGPDPGCLGTGMFALLVGGSPVATVGVTPPSIPVGTVQVLTVTATVPAADLAAGTVALVGRLETYHLAPGTCPGTGPGGARVGGWIVDDFTASVVYDQAGCGEQVFATVVTDCETGTVESITYTLPDGTPYTPTGIIGQCETAGGGACCPQEPCRDTSTLLVCDLPTDGSPAPTVTDTSGASYYPYTTGVPTAGAQTLWDGGTLTLPDAAGPQPGTTGTVRTAAATLQAPRPACDAGTARVTVQVDVTQLGPDDGCASTGFLGLYNGVGEANRIALALTPPNTPAGWNGTLTAEADVPADDLAAGNIAVLLAFDAYDDSGTVCPPPRRTSWQLTAFDAVVVYDQAGCETQILRTVVTDCESGEVFDVTDTTLDGAPYTVTGEVGQCTPAGGGSCCPSPQPCGDTETVQLCDLTYDPQAPIPTPAGDFTLTGNVVAANGGTTLWFAQANQPADGVAELTVSGLLPATLYEFRFASAWIGAGAPTPATNNAVYLLEILDGGTLLATRTRNVSNGSNVFPGGVLTEDMPPLPFIAPATGAVTIRFTDQTTGGPVNDRDLFLMPLEVRTAVLTLTATPFLRRFTYGCDGDLTATQDLALDGATPYVLEGEAGHCTADGGTTGAVTPCDVQNVIEACRCDDTDGDGLPDVGYVELLAVDCEGTLTSLGTYTDGLTGPYTPVSPVDCNALDEAEGADPAFGVQARRVELTAGASWDAAAWPTLQSVTAVAHSGNGTVTTADGPSTLHAGESATWSVARDADAALTGPLTITAGTGTVTLSYTIGVTL
ncbi:hypothetical protein [Streptomyces tendae]|uniref:hypothetical protein n=1 Tax=Streptomyces tendae TaxID=1932 RepID=UPI003413C83A